MSRNPLFKHEVKDAGNLDRDITTVDVLNLDVCGEETTLSLTEVIDDLGRALASIPEQFRDKAVLQINGYGEYVSVHAVVQFTRPETNEEFVDRKRWLEGLDEENEKRDRCEFERLKQKYMGAA